MAVPTLLARLESSGAVKTELPSEQVLRYALFDPSPCGYPPPRVPLLPALQRTSWTAPGSSHFSVVGQGQPRRVYRRGRYALYDAYRLCGAGPGSAVLVPAYHCRTMLDPAISLGSNVQLYPLDPRLAPDLGAVQRLIAASPVPVRALLLTHYFGVAQQAGPVRALCDAHGIALIEDCSHALFNSSTAPRLGQHGRYTIASPYKLFPCEEGGWLLPGAGVPLPAAAPRHADWLSELKVLRDAWLRRKGGRAHAPQVADVAQQLREAQAAPAPTARSSTAPVPGPSPLYRAEEQAEPGARAAGWLMQLCSVDALARRRRDNYARWQQAMAGLPHARPLFAALPDDCVPYMFPLLIDHPEAHFPPLKQLGMPIWRWDEMALSDCGVAAHFSRHLLHLPCHQSASSDDMAWMIEAVTRVLRDVPVQVPPA